MSLNLLVNIAIQLAPTPAPRRRSDSCNPLSKKIQPRISFSIDYHVDYPPPPSSITTPNKPSEMTRDLSSKRNTNKEINSNNLACYLPAANILRAIAI